MMDSKQPTSISLTGETYKGSALYWGIIGIAVVVFTVTTLRYWLGTLKVLDESAQVRVEVKHVPKKMP